MNKKGFTLIELLATIVVLGTIMTIAIVAVTDSINSSKDDTYVNLAKNYAEAARTMRSQDKLYYEPKNGEALLIPYNIIRENVDIEKDKSPYGTLDPTYSYIAIINNSGNYSYYVNQVDDSNHIINRVNANSLKTSDIVEENPISINSLKELKAPLTSFSITYGNNEYDVKAVGIEFSATYSDLFNGINPTYADFDLYEREIKFKGTIKMFSDHLELSLINNELGALDNKTYVFKEKNNNTWYAVDEDDEILISNGHSLSMTITFRTDGYSFNFYVDNSIVYENVFATKTTTLYGYFTKDSSYVLSNALVKNSISYYDGFAQTGKFQTTNNNLLTIKGINYSVNGSKILYVVVKK